MQVFRNLTVIGTSHVAIESVKEAEKVILSRQPKVVALELDRPRFLALLQKKKRERFNWKLVKEIGLKGVLFGALGAWIERKIGKMVGVAPGTEMKVAAVSAAKVKADVALIDRDIRVTIRNMFKYITWREKLRFLWDLFKGLVLRQGEVKRFDLRKVPPEKLIDELLKKTRKRYPGFYKALVSERNAYMAKNLYKLMTKYKEEEIVAVVGAGHEKDIIKLIRKKDGIQVHKKRN